MDANGNSGNNEEILKKIKSKTRFFQIILVIEIIVAIANVFLIGLKFYEDLNVKPGTCASYLDLSKDEIVAYNSQFDCFFGEKERGSSVKQLIRKVHHHNKSNEKDEYGLTRRISMSIIALGEYERMYQSGEFEKTLDLERIDKVEESTIKSGYMYKIAARKNSYGLISMIYIAEYEYKK